MVLLPTSTISYSRKSFPGTTHEPEESASNVILEPREVTRTTIPGLGVGAGDSVGPYLLYTLTERRVDPKGSASLMDMDRHSQNLVAPSGDKRLWLGVYRLDLFSVPLHLQAAVPGQLWAPASFPSHDSLYSQF